MSWKNVQYQNGKYRTTEGGGGSSTFAGLDDVSFSDVQNGQVPKYNSTTQKWENANESGGGGTVTDVEVDGVSVVNQQGVAEITIPTPPTPDYPVTDVKVNGTSVVSNKQALITSYKEVTQAQYESLPSTKESDGIAYFIKDARSSGGNGIDDVLVDGTSVVGQDNIARLTTPEADDISYDNTISGMTATNIQDAFDELAQDFQDGCDIIEQAVIAKGQTPASNSPQDIADAISQISGGGTDEVVEITSYTTNISPSTWYRRCILKVNHRIIFHVNFDGGSTSGGVWNDVITLNAEDVADVTEFTYGADSYTGYFSSSGGAYNKIARYNPTTRKIQVWGGLSSRTNLFAGLRDVQVYDPEYLTPVIQNSSVISDIGNKIIQIGGFVIAELDCKMGSGAGASWYDKVIRLNTKYTLSGGYWAGSKMQTEGNPMSRDMGVNGSNGELNIFPSCDYTSVWIIRMILKVSGLQS